MSKPSLYGKNPDANDGLDTFAVERIKSEIAHLKKRKTVRTFQQDLSIWSRIFGFFFIIAFLSLVFMDPFYYAYEKDKAIRSYLYLHAYDNRSKTSPLEQCGILDESELLTLRLRTGDLHDVFPSSDAAAAAASEVVNYVQSVRDLHAGRYEKLSWINKIRCFLFIRMGFPLPIQSSMLSPVVGTNH